MKVAFRSDCRHYFIISLLFLFLLILTIGCDGGGDDNDNDDNDDNSAWYSDADGDGYGDPSAIMEAVAKPNGYVNNDDDCNDKDSNINPGKMEVHGDGKDNNCDGQIDEGDDFSDFTGQWRLKDTVNDDCDISVEIELTLTLTQIGKSIKGSLRGTSKAIGCCGPLIETYDIEGTVNEETATLFFNSLNEYDQCDCLKNSCYYKMTSGGGASDSLGSETKDVTTYVKSGKRYLHFKNPPCLFMDNYTGLCRKYVTDFYEIK